jgi:hypothetical protein
VLVIAASSSFMLALNLGSRRAEYQQHDCRQQWRSAGRAERLGRSDQSKEAHFGFAPA